MNRRPQKKNGKYPTCCGNILPLSVEAEVRRETEQLLKETGARAMKNHDRLCVAEEADSFFIGDVFNPERNLIASILERAIFDLSSADAKTRREAEKWFMSENVSAFSFYWVLDVLGLRHVASLIRRKMIYLMNNEDLRCNNNRNCDLVTMWKTLPGGL